MAGIAVGSGIPIGTFSAALAILREKGVRYNTAIDLGCADGHFFLQHYLLGIFPDTVPFNIDANALYEDSLRAIKEVCGGDYLIGAIADRSGTIEMTVGAHPYWSSLRPADDPYWQRINGLHRGKTEVPVFTLDAVAAERKLKPPYLLKLDIQGAEVQALAGAAHILADTSVVICEADLDDFHPIHAALDAAGFDLFDLTQIARITDQSLGWFYPVYLKRSLGHLRQRGFWKGNDNAQSIATRTRRREGIVRTNAETLRKISEIKKAGRKP